MNIKVEKIGMGTKPDPYKYEILEWELVDGNTIILAKYDGCTTFGGKKLLLLKGEHTEFETLDPHFFEGHPIEGRFKPTLMGWVLAQACAQLL